MDDNPFASFGNGTEPQSDSAFHPHIDPSLQSATASAYATSPTLQNNRHNVPFYPPHAPGANSPYQGLQGPLPGSRQDMQRMHNTAPSRGRVTQHIPPNTGGGQFGILKLSYPELPPQPRVRQDVSIGIQTTEDTEKKNDIVHLAGLRKVPNPPDLEMWREKLFSVNEIIYLTEDEFQIYFPHVDNVYSHRSTQQYKRKPFITSYWDCRLKGRPPGTAKSTDPSKKKRKRVARERNLCDVKIKITEYFPGARQFMAGTTQPQADQSQTDSFFVPDGPFDTPGQAQAFVDLVGGPTATTEEAPLPGADGSRFYSIQRVNGSCHHGEHEELAGGHKHDLAESDRVKKNSIVRDALKDEKAKKKLRKTYAKKVTGAAANTIRRHSKEHDLKFYASCFCPFVQQVWIALEVKKMDYQYIEVDPFNKPTVLTDIHPQGIIPAIRHGDSFSCYESTVILQYLEDIHATNSLTPSSAAQRAYGGMWIDHINKSLVPSFYALTQAQETSTQLAKTSELRASLNKLVQAADLEGPFFSGPDLTLVDIHAAPFLLRLSRVLKPLRGWPDAEEGSRLRIWLDAFESHSGIKATLSSDDVYSDSHDHFGQR